MYACFHVYNDVEEFNLDPWKENIMTITQSIDTKAYVIDLPLLWIFIFVALLKFIFNSRLSKSCSKKIELCDLIKLSEV